MARTGARLREARQSRGTTLQQVAASTKISVPALEAIEREDVARLPGGIFLRAFVRSYAAEVGLDPERVVADFLADHPEEASLADVEAVAAVVESSHRRTARGRLIAAGVGAVALVAAGVWVAREVGVFSSVTRSQEAVAADEAPAPWRAIPSAEPVALHDEADGSVPSNDAVRSVDVPVSDSVEPAASVSAGPPRLAIHPTAACWVRVTMGGVVRFAGEMRAGEREEFELTGPVLVEVGNAGAFDFSIDDTPGRPLGAVGQVVRARIDPSRVDEFLVQ